MTADNCSGVSVPYLFCGDDFTGASDTLATLARAGLRARLFLDVEKLAGDPGLSRYDAVGVATAARSQSPAEMADALWPVAELAARLTPAIFHYKVCSTFDSSPLVGSIGAALKLFRQQLLTAPVFIYGGQPSLRRYCLYSNLFAVGPDGDIHRIDRHPTMANHPVTPMTEADLRRALHAQGIESPGWLHSPLYDGPVTQLEARVDALLRDGRPILCDVRRQSDLAVLGRLMHQKSGSGSPLIAIGSSSVAEAYLTRPVERRASTAARLGCLPQKPVFVLAGSRSPVTAEQVAGCRGYQRVTVEPRLVESEGKTYLRDLVTTCLDLLQGGTNVLAVVSPCQDHSLHRSELAAFTGALAAKIGASGAVDRLCIAGGDTSSLALQQMAPDSISYLADISPGLCLCCLHGSAASGIDGLQVVLKGGQMGLPGLFDSLLGPL